MTQILILFNTQNKKPKASQRGNEFHNTPVSDKIFICRIVTSYRGVFLNSQYLAACRLGVVILSVWEA
jgi:hypothetical protein